jgi:hypothetical protein
MLCFVSGDVLSCRCLNLDHLRSGRLICSCRCMNLDCLRCRRLICSCNCLNLDYLRCRRLICSCKCLRLNYLQSRHLIIGYPWSFSTFGDRTCLCNASLSLLLPLARRYTCTEVQDHCDVIPSAGTCVLLFFLPKVGKVRRSWHE